MRCASPAPPLQCKQPTAAGAAPTAHALAAAAVRRRDRWRRQLLQEQQWHPRAMQSQQASQVTHPLPDQLLLQLWRPRLQLGLQRVCRDQPSQRCRPTVPAHTAAHRPQRLCHQCCRQQLQRQAQGRHGARQQPSCVVQRGQPQGWAQLQRERPGSAASGRYRQRQRIETRWRLHQRIQKIGRQYHHCSMMQAQAVSQEAWQAATWRSR